jgi:hypothetical protein
MLLPSFEIWAKLNESGVPLGGGFVAEEKLHFQPLGHSP